jgi:alkylhydroperoxidase/carboxymuconolactone decarboxylase family protein YurZ
MTAHPSTARRAELKQAFVDARGHWSPWLDDLLELDPDYFEAYLGFSSVPWRKGTLEPKVKELVYVAIDAATTHLYEPGLRAHVEQALRHGATVQEIMEVYELTSVLGIHTTTVAVPILIEELVAAGHDNPVERPLTEREQALKDEFIRVRGYWSELWDGVLALDADFFEAYFRFSAVPFQNGTLEPKVRELIYIAIDASTTHLFEPGTRIHIRNALAHGATAAEIMEVLELTSILGVHTMSVGVPILIEAAAAVAAARNGGTP